MTVVHELGIEPQAEQPVLRHRNVHGSTGAAEPPDGVPERTDRTGEDAVQLDLCGKAARHDCSER